MATANFKSMDHFPLYAHDNIREGYCPECDCWFALDGEDTVCPDCGAELESIDTSGIYDDIFVQDVRSALDDLPEFEFYDISVVSGYYTGYQLLVSIKPCEDDDTDGLTDEDCAEWYGCTVAELKERIERERERIRNILSLIGAHFGFTELAIVGRFSSGECIYREVSQTATEALPEALHEKRQKNTEKEPGTPQKAA